MAKLLSIPLEEWNKEKNYLKKLKNDWKRYHPKEQGSIRSCPDEVHCGFYKSKLAVDVAKRVKGELFEVWKRAGWDRWVFPEHPQSLTGWKLTKSKNHALLYRCSLGRLRLFETGTVEMHVNKPITDGKAMQLFCDAFTKTYLVTDIRVVDAFKEELMRRWHGTYKTGQRQPYMKITTFQDTHKFVFISGDRTHPDCFEFIVEYHAEVERARRLFDQMQDFFSQFSNGSSGVGKPLKNDYSV